MEIPGEVEVVCDHELPMDKPTVWKRYRGLIFGGLYALGLSLTNLVVKNLTHYHPTAVSMWRNGGILIPALCTLLIYQFKAGSNKAIFSSAFPINNRERTFLAGGLVVRGVFGGIARIFYTWAQKYITIGDASIFSSSVSIYVVCLAAICLGESCGFILSSVILVTLFGVALITRPPMLTGQTSFNTNNLIGVAFSVAAVFTTACVMILLRRMRKVHWLLVFLASGIFGFLTSFIVAAAYGELALPIGLQDCLLTYVALPTVLSVAQMSLFLAFKFEKAGPVSLIASSEIVFSFLLQFAAFGVVPDAYSWVGGAIVVFGLVLTTFRKWVDELPSEDERKRKLKFILL